MKCKYFYSTLIGKRACEPPERVNGNHRPWTLATKSHQCVAELLEVLISETNHPTIYFLTKIEELEVSAFHAGPAQKPTRSQRRHARRKLKLIRLGHNTPASDVDPAPRRANTRTMRPCNSPESK
ncbi:hypothetical protein EVAR_95644_1 [Eumeta japonica]|uniref:Uncharacterized protein n=1 Tax=Eumeta variegata TaxID=151549 RepID=A0A4C2ACM7_EUMVA|nr:hypothetical protein EVAR_95644_1 [Eumeta japonica]